MSRFEEQLSLLISQWNRLSAPSITPKIVCLPDFFFDILVSPDKEYSEFLGEMDEVVSRGGGYCGPVEFSPGGNAGNMAMVLSALGVNSVLVTEVSSLGKQIIASLMSPYEVELAITDIGIMPTTVAFEFKTAEGVVSNFMINSNLDSLSDFGSEKLEEFQWQTIESADIVSVTNFCANNSYIELVRSISSRLSSRKLFLDFSDLTKRQDRIEEVHELISDVSPNLYCISLNENEVANLNGEPPGLSDPLENGISLSRKHPSSTFVLHTSLESFEIINGSVERAQSLPVIPIRATGAGDTFNAGYLAALALEVDPALRLLFANCCAAYRVDTRQIPSIPSVKRFIEDFLEEGISKEGTRTKIG